MLLVRTNPVITDREIIRHNVFRMYVREVTAWKPETCGLIRAIESFYSERSVRKSNLSRMC